MSAAIALAICNDPGLNKSYAEVNYRMQNVDSARGAYYPSVNATANRSTGLYSSQTASLPVLDYHLRSSANDTAINATWTIFDFGARASALEEAEALASASRSLMDANTLKVVSSAVGTYIGYQSDEIAARTAQQLLDIAESSLKLTEGRHQQGLGRSSDVLQANAKVIEASLRLQRARGTAAQSAGSLASVLGQRLDLTFQLAIDDDEDASAPIDLPVGKLIDAACAAHPSLVTARAQLQAAERDITRVKAEGLPTVSLFVQLDRNQQPGQLSFNTLDNEKVLGVQLKIPLFEGFQRSHNIQAARDLADEKAADVASTERQVTLAIWKAYQTLGVTKASLRLAKDFYQASQASFTAARDRYVAGVGSILELLQAQSDLTNAQQEVDRAAGEWRASRVEIALSLGVVP